MQFGNKKSVSDAVDCQEENEKGRKGRGGKNGDKDFYYALFIKIISNINTPKILGNLEKCWMSQK